MRRIKLTGEHRGYALFNKMLLFPEKSSKNALFFRKNDSVFLNLPKKLGH